MELWKDIPGFNGLYQASTFGQIRSNKKTLKPRKHNKGYLRVSIFQKDYYIHRLIGITFLHQKEGKTEINHLDGNKQNNSVSNLEWCNRLENTKHSEKLETTKIGHKAQALKISGENSCRSKFNDATILELRYKYKNGSRPCSLAKEYSISISTLEKILYRKTWKHL